MGESTQNDNINENVSCRRIKWIDCTKTVAIIAVAVDHCNGFCYSSPLVAQMSYFSVSLFILLSGISTGLSFPRRKSYIHQIKKCGMLFLQYAIATLIIQVYSQKFFDLKMYIAHILSFDIQGPFYFLLFYFQLALIAPLLMDWYAFCREQKKSWLWHSITLGLLGYLSYIFIAKTYILPVWGGGQFLLGGTYLLLFYIGILLSRYANLSLKKRALIIILLTATITWIMWLLLMTYKKLPFDQWMLPYWGNGLNPPSVELMVYALITLVMLFAVFTLAENMNNKIAGKIIDTLSFLGRNTFYIFMYHLLVKDMLLNFFPILINSNIWLRRWFVFCPMIVLPAIGVSVIRCCKKRVYRCVEGDHYCLKR